MDDAFFPPGTKVDLDDYEGGLPIDLVVEPPATQLTLPEPPTTKLTPPVPLKDTVNCIVIKVPATQWMQACTAIGSTSADKENTGPERNTSASNRIIQGARFKLRLPAAQLMTTNPESEGTINKETSTGPEEGQTGQRTFCPTECHEAIIMTMEKHYCAHLSILGYAAPDRGAI